MYGPWVPGEVILAAFSWSWLVFVLGFWFVREVSARLFVVTGRYMYRFDLRWGSKAGKGG